MSDFEETQPTHLVGDTAPIKVTEETPPPPPPPPPLDETSDTLEPPAPRKRRGRFWLAALALVILLALGGASGYFTGIGDRRNAQSSIVSQQLAQQFEMAALDMAEGRYGQARQRFEYIIEVDPNYPGITEALTEVMLKMSITPTVTPTMTPSLTPTPDLRGAQSIYDRATQLVAAGDWNGAITALNELRKADPTFQLANVDGMYYISLRNLGVDLISREGNLEGGIYHLTLAERFGPLDGSSLGLREGAKLYLTGASFWELDWDQVIFYFSQVYQSWPGLWDSSSNMTAGERYRVANIKLGDKYFGEEKYCLAEESYLIALSIAPDNEVNNKALEAGVRCRPPTETPEATPTLPTPTGPAPTEPTPTETPQGG
jgi:tetratricopeptide (TPR) repeat protein